MEFSHEFPISLGAAMRSVMFASECHSFILDLSKKHMSLFQVGI